jgi:hypothetical protein
MTTLADFANWFDDRVRDAAARITELQKERAIAQAVKRYNELRPQQSVQDYPGDGATFDLALPTGWVTGMSTIRQMEYPAGQRVPVLLERDDWQFYQTPTSTKIRLLQVTPVTGKTLRLTFTKPHGLDYSGSTIPSQDEEAVTDLAASIGLRDLAAAFAGTVDPTIAADSVEYRTKASEYSQLADKLEKRWRAHMGLDQTSEAQAASAFVDVDQTDSLGHDKLTHPNRNR